MGDWAISLLPCLAGRDCIPRMPNNLDSMIQQIVSRAASQILQAVRMNLNGEITRLVAVQPGRAATAPRGNRGQAARTAKAASAARQAARPATSQAPGKKRRGVSDDELNLVLDYISRNPGKRGEDI